MLWQSTMEAIFLLRHLMEKYRVVCKDLHIVFIDIETCMIKYLKRLLRICVRKEMIFFFKYIKVIKDMCDGAIISVRTNGGITSESPITISFYLGSALSS